MHSIARQKLGTFYNNIIPYRCVHNILTCLTVILQAEQVALLSQRGRAMLRVCQQLQQYKTSSRVFYCKLRRLQIYHCVQLNALFCCLWRNVTLKLLVINISSFSPAINTAAYYQRCETVAVVYWRPCLQHLAYCSVNTGSQARYRLRIAISAYPTCIQRHRQRGYRPNIAVLFGTEKLERCGYTMVKKC